MRVKMLFFMFPSKHIRIEKQTKKYVIIFIFIGELQTHFQV